MVPPIPSSLAVASHVTVEQLARYSALAARRRYICQVDGSTLETTSRTWWRRACSAATFVVLGIDVLDPSTVADDLAAVGDAFEALTVQTWNTWLGDLNYAYFTAIQCLTNWNRFPLHLFRPFALLCFGCTGYTQDVLILTYIVTHSFNSTKVSFVTWWRHLSSGDIGRQIDITLFKLGDC